MPEVHQTGSMQTSKESHWQGEVTRQEKKKGGRANPKLFIVRKAIHGLNIYPIK